MCAYDILVITRTPYDGGSGGEVREIYSPRNTDAIRIRNIANVPEAMAVIAVPVFRRFALKRGTDFPLTSQTTLSLPLHSESPKITRCRVRTTIYRKTASRTTLDNRFPPERTTMKENSTPRKISVRHKSFFIPLALATHFLPLPTIWHNQMPIEKAHRYNTRWVDKIIFIFMLGHGTRFSTSSYKGKSSV